MTRVLVVAGVDTGVGKTIFSLALAQAARQKGLSVCAIKPIESGCDDSDNEDGRRLARATGQAKPREAIQRFKAAISPWLAAEAESARPQPQLWLDAIAAARESFDLIIVEGAGGLLSPLAPHFDLRQLIVALDAEVFLVAADRLGAQANILCNLEALHSVGRVRPRVVLSAVEAENELGNREVLARVCPDLEIISLMHAEDGKMDLLAQSLECWL